VPFRSEQPALCCNTPQTFFVADVGPQVDAEKHVDTTFTLLNTHPEETVGVRIFFVGSNGTLSLSRASCVAPGAKLSFKASENGFQTSGYAIAVAVSAAGCPTSFNYLVGSESVEAADGSSFTLGAMAIPALYHGAAECSNNPIAEVKFDGVNYAMLPRTLALDNLPAGQERAVTVVANSLSGNLNTGSEAGMRGLKLAGQVLGGGENNKNFTADGGPHTVKLTGDLVSGLGDFHADQRSGWLRLWTTDDAPVFGVALTPAGAKQLVATSFTRSGVLSFVTGTTCVPPSGRHQADLALYATSAVKQTATQGQNVNFKFKVFNGGPEAASVGLSGSLDAKLKVVACVDSNGAPCAANGSGDPSLNLLIFNPFSLGVGEYKEFNVTAQVASDVTAASVLKSSWNVGFNVNPGESWTDPDTSNGGVAFAVEIPANAGNHAPVAVAKPITGPIVAPDGKFVTLTLDGTASSDVDGDPLEFQWMDNGDLVSTKAKQEVEFPVGSHRVVLTVSDGRGGTATAVLNFTVLTATPPPSNSHSADLAITPNRTLRAVQFGETVTLKFTVSNNGPEVATPRIYGQFSEVMQIVSCTDSLGNVCHGGGVSTDYREFPDVPLAVGATREITTTFKMPSSDPSGLINRASWGLGFVANSADETWTDPDNFNNHGSITFELPNAPANVPPVAKIVLNSPNQPTTLTAGSDGLASITLFGTQSSDPDNNGIATYEWLKNGQLVSKRAIDVFKLGAGTHSFVLRVTDYRNGVGLSDPLVITVLDSAAPPPPAVNKPPVARALPLPATLGADSSGKATVQLNGAGSSDPDGDALIYEWKDNGQVILTAATGSVQLSAGAHSIVLTVNDGHGGGNSTAPQTVTVTGTVNPPTMSELAISDLTPNNGKRGTKVTVTVVGSGFVPGSIVTVNSGGVTVVTTYVSPTMLTATFQISGNTMANVRAVTVMNPNGVSATKPNAFTIKP